jgi:cytochrome c biogenesis factor
MNIDPSTQTVAVMMLITPMVSWIWIAVFMMGIGGLIALIPVRRPVVVTEKDSVPEDALTA